MSKQLLDLSPAARRRRKWMDYYRTQGQNARRTCRHFDISSQTFYRGWRRYDPHDLTRLESQSGAPRGMDGARVNRQLRQWERIDNTVRPHQALGYRTPREFLRMAHAG